MKIYNVNLTVTLTQIAEIPDLPPEPPAETRKPFNDDPVDKQADMLNRYLEKAEQIFFPNRGPAMPYGDQPGVSMTETVCVAAANFDDLQAILRRFSQTLTALPTVPDSLLANPMRPPVPGR